MYMYKGYYTTTQKYSKKCVKISFLSNYFHDKLSYYNNYYIMTYNSEKNTHH